MHTYEPMWLYLIWRPLLASYELGLLTPCDYIWLENHCLLVTRHKDNPMWLMFDLKTFIYWQSDTRHKSLGLQTPCNYVWIKDLCIQSTRHKGLGYWPYMWLCLNWRPLYSSKQTQGFGLQTLYSMFDLKDLCLLATRHNCLGLVTLYDYVWLEPDSKGDWLQPDTKVWV